MRDCRRFNFVPRRGRSPGAFGARRPAGSGGGRGGRRRRGGGGGGAGCQPSLAGFLSGARKPPEVWHNLSRPPLSSSSSCCCSRCRCRRGWGRAGAVRPRCPRVCGGAAAAPRPARAWLSPRDPGGAGGQEALNYCNCLSVRECRAAAAAAPLPGSAQGERGVRRAPHRHRGGGHRHEHLYVFLRDAFLASARAGGWLFGRVLKDLGSLVPAVFPSKTKAGQEGKATSPSGCVARPRSSPRVPKHWRWERALPSLKS